MDNQKLQEQVEASIRSASSVYTEAGWLAWAEGWLSGKDRTAASALIAFADAYTDANALAFAAYTDPDDDDATDIAVAYDSADHAYAAARAAEDAAEAA